MNRSYTKIRHIQETNLKLEQRRFTQLLESTMGNVKPLINEQDSPHKKYPRYHDKNGNMIGDLGKMENYAMDVWRKEDGGSSFGIDVDFTSDTSSLTNGGRKVVWDFKQNKIFFEKDLKFDPNPLPLNSNFNTFKTWFDKNNQQSNLSDFGGAVKSMVGLK
jgi:hypothetical protein